MQCPDLFGWKPVPITKSHPQWDAVRRLRVAGAPDLPTLDMVNSWVNNHITYTPDGADHWQGPNETLQLRHGDCEDIAILKRAMLIAAGYADTNILFALVHDLISRRDHAVLVVDGVVLDCFISRALPVGQVRDYSPIMAFASDSCWVFGRAV